MLADLEERLGKVIREFAGARPDEELDTEEAVRSLDSLDKMDLIHRIEDEFCIKMDNLDNIDNYQDIIKNIRPKLG